MYHLGALRSTLGVLERFNVVVRHCVIGFWFILYLAAFCFTPAIYPFT
jgi:hypothetical protein